MNTQRISLDLSKRTGNQQIVIAQGDASGTTIVATIYDAGTKLAETGVTAQFLIELPDGKHYVRDNATYNAGVITYVCDESKVASVHGYTDNAYFTLTKGNTIVSTERFAVIVKPCAYDGMEVADSYDSAIQDAIDALDAAVADMPDMVEDVLEAHPEWTTTVQDGSITKAKLATDLARDRERLLYRLANMLTNALPEGETATATDAAKTPVAGLALYGRSTQGGTPTPSAPVPIVSVAGNLLDVARSGSRTDSGVTWTYNADGTVTVTGTATGNPWSHTSALEPAVTLPAGTYTASVSAPFGIVVQANGSSLYVGTNNAYAFTLSAESSVRVYARAVQGTTYTGETTGIMLTRGSTAYPYVPYGSVGLWARGRNLWQTVKTQTISGVTFTANADGSVTLNGTATATINQETAFTVPETGTYRLSGCPSGGSGSTYKLWTYDTSTPRDPQITDTGSGGTGTLTQGHIIVLRIRIQSGYTCSNVTLRPMLTFGSAAQEFVPYTETVTPIPLDGHELRSLPDGTRDEVTVDEYGHAVLTQRVGEVTFDGSEVWSLSGGGGYRVNVNSLVDLIRRPSTTSETLSMFSPYFVGVSDAATYSGTVGISCRTNGILGITPTGQATTVADWTAWLAEHPLTVLYPLATPVTIDLGYVAAVPLCGPDLTAQAIPTAPFALTYERDLNATLARLESAIAELATN